MLAPRSEKLLSICSPFTDNINFFSSSLFWSFSKASLSAVIVLTLSSNPLTLNPSGSLLSAFVPSSSVTASCVLSCSLVVSSSLASLSVDFLSSAFASCFSALTSKLPALLPIPNPATAINTAIAAVIFPIFFFNFPLSSLDRHTYIDNADTTTGTTIARTKIVTITIDIICLFLFFI